MTGDTRPILYSFRRCPFAMRARMAIAASGVQVRLREIVLRDKPEAMLEASPKGTVPVLVLPEGGVLDESLDVMLWALDLNDPEEWLACDTAETFALVDENDGPFKHHLDRYKYASRYESEDARDHRDAGEVILRSWDARLREHGQFFGPAPRFPDIALFPFVRQFRIADKDWFDAQDWTALKDWLFGHMESPRFKAVMTKYPLWKETGEEVDFPKAA